MAKKKKNTKSIRNPKAPPKSKPINWKKWCMNSAIFSVFAVLIIVSFSIYSHIQKKHYDLSVVGNGTPTVVQFHDPNCQLCRQLKSNVDSVKGEFTDQVQFKIANMGSAKGKAFASKHNVPHVTLLFFNDKGRRVNMLQGVTPKKDIKTALTQLTK